MRYPSNDEKKGNNKTFPKQFGHQTNASVTVHVANGYMLIKCYDLWNTHLNRARRTCYTNWIKQI